MPNNSEPQMINLRIEWKKFGNIILRPVNFVLLVLSAGFYVASIKQVDTSYNAILALLLSLVTGLLGGLWAKDLEKMNDERIIVARGKNAIRSLKLLFGNIISLDQRAQIYLQRDQEFYKKETNSETVKEAVKTYLEDVILRCSLIEEQVISSIENWMDVIPEEADVKTEIGYLTELKTGLDKLTAERDFLKGRLEEKENSEQEKNRLENELISLEERFLELQARYTNQRIQVGSKLLPTMPAELTSGATFFSKGSYGRRSELLQNQDISIEKFLGGTNTNYKQGKIMIHELLDKGCNQEDIVKKLVLLDFDEEWALKKTRDIFISDPKYKGRNNGISRKNGGDSSASKNR